VAPWVKRPEPARLPSRKAGSASLRPAGRILARRSGPAALLPEPRSGCFHASADRLDAHGLLLLLGGYGFKDPVYLPDLDDEDVMRAAWQR